MTERSGKTSKEKTGGTKTSSPRQPKIGIFWYYRKKLLTYSQPVADVAEDCGFIDVAMGHIDFWKTLQKLDPTLKDLEYEEIPRGRVLFDAGKKRYKVYSSKKLIADPAFRKLVLRTFNLTVSETAFVSDLHYESPESINWDK